MSATSQSLRWRDAVLDYSGEGCMKCGKWPLSVQNKSGYCRECSRNHYNGKTRRRIRNGRNV